MGSGILGFGLRARVLCLVLAVILSPSVAVLSVLARSWRSSPLTSAADTTSLSSALRHPTRPWLSAVRRLGLPHGCEPLAHNPRLWWTSLAGHPCIRWVPPSSSSASPTPRWAPSVLRSSSPSRQRTSSPSSHGPSSGSMTSRLVSLPYLSPRLDR